MRGPEIAREPLHAGARLDRRSREEPGMIERTVRTIAQRLSLRPPQTASLETLADVLGRIELSKDVDSAAALAANP
jgi:hypothetical protein